MDAAHRRGDSLAGDRPDASSLPNPLPRPRDELAELERIWASPTGWRVLTDVNNNRIGALYIGAALLFFVLAGILALLMRIQLAIPENDWLSPNRYNQLFTMHGTVMMFLFAVPVMEAFAVLLLPNMLGARDLPFPRLSAYAFWAYLIGGLVFFGSILVDMAPQGGWFMYPPLTSARYSPGVGADFWLLGIGFIEISAIAGAIEIIVGVLRTRAPGMTLDRIPIYVWSLLVFAVMIIFAFPAVILATLLLEMERAFDWPFFDPERGGAPLLWQHLFWFFGHPEVYIIFLPAAGMVSMIVPAMVRMPLIGYRLIVLALVGTAFLSFGLWVHHMFATGIPQLSLSFFSAASMAIAIPSGIQIFAWIATIASGRVRWHTPMLFVVGFLSTFVLGGLTGVMVAVVPFDWQAHDTYFVVAHLHYVLFGGMVFPMFAAFYYWMPFASRRALSERLGRWVFWLIFVGFNLAFLPMHITGLAGMPRRVHTYSAGLGWDSLNLVSTVGAFAIACGVAVFLIDLARNYRFATNANAGNLWAAPSLEWLPSGNYSSRSIPVVTSGDPLWTQPNLAKDVEAGRYYLPGSATGGRETIVTSPIEAQAQYILLLPPPGWSPFLAAVGTAGFFLLLTAKLVALASMFGLLAVAAMLVWMWDRDPGFRYAPVDVGGGLCLPTYTSGVQSHARWAMVVLLMAAASLFACLVFSYLFLWTVSPSTWSRSTAPVEGPAAVIGATMLIASVVALRLGDRALSNGHRGRAQLGLFVTSLLLLGSCAAEVLGLASSALSPVDSAYGGLIGMFVAFQGFYVLAASIMLGFSIARIRAGRLDHQRRLTFECTRMFVRYAVIQTLVGSAVVHGFPRMVA